MPFPSTGPLFTQLEFQTLAVYLLQVRVMNESGAWIRGLGDQTPNLVVEAGSTQRGVLVKVPFENHLGGLDGFGSQGGIRFESHSVVVQLEISGRTKSLPVNQFQGGGLHRRIDKRDAWIYRSAEAEIVGVAQAGRDKEKS